METYHLLEEHFENEKKKTEMWTTRDVFERTRIKSSLKVDSVF